MWLFMILTSPLTFSRYRSSGVYNLEKCSVKLLKKEILRNKSDDVAKP